MRKKREEPPDTSLKFEHREFRCARCGEPSPERKSQSHFVFLRHGLTDMNKENIVIGSIDVPLNEKGFE